MGILDSIIQQIGRYLPRGMKYNFCELHGSYLSHYSNKEPKCQECLKNSNSNGNGTTATEVEHYINLRDL